MRLLITIAVLYFTVRWIIMPFFQGLMAPEEREKIKPAAKQNQRKGEYVDYEEVE